MGKNSAHLGLPLKGMGIEEIVACFVALLPSYLQLQGKVGMGTNSVHLGLPLMGMGIEEIVACFVALLPCFQFQGKVGMGRNSAHLGLPLKEMGIEERVACSVALLPCFQSMKKVGMGIEDGVADFVVQNSAVHLGLPLIEKVGMGIVAHLVGLDFLQLMGKEKVAFAPLGSHQNQDIQMLAGETSLEVNLEFPEATSPCPPSHPRPGLSSPVPLAPQHRC